MKESMSNDVNEVQVNAEAFAIATQMYLRMRRVCSRVIDVNYLVHNKEYARHIIEIALTQDDAELERQGKRLSLLMNLYPEPSVEVIETKVIVEPQKEEILETYCMEATAEEIYQAQVSHHYIGALR